jgi:hypothetical protein
VIIHDAKHTGQLNFAQQDTGYCLCIRRKSIVGINKSPICCYFREKVWQCLQEKAVKYWKKCNLENNNKINFLPSYYMKHGD